MITFSTATTACTSTTPSYYFTVQRPIDIAHARLQALYGNLGDSQQQYASRMRMEFAPDPNWRVDPSYSWSKKSCRKFCGA